MGWEGAVPGVTPTDAPRVSTARDQYLSGTYSSRGSVARS